MMNEMARPSDRSPRRWLAWPVAVALTVMLAGCGDRDTIDAARTMTFYPVKGKVSLPDGKPLTLGRVIFVGTKNSVTSPASIESDGSFTVKGTKDGLPEGPYKVRIEVGDTGPAKKRATLPFATKYLDEDASPLTATVTPEGPNDFDLKLTSQ